MANQQPQIVSIDGVEHKVEDLTEQQQMLLNHVADLERKIGSTKFQLDQLSVGRDAFFTMLKAALEAKPEVSDVEPK
jgi:septal ring factor EnvC (AmiA/AmiB activator)